jgi:hypothetical protein
MASQFGHGEGAALRERRLLELAAGQHGVVSVDQLRALGLSSSGTRRRVAGGRLHTMHRGVYAVGRPDVSVHGRWMAAVLACGPVALLSHGSAAALHGLLSHAGASLHVTIPRRVGRSRPGIRIHRSTCLTPLDRAFVEGIPCTSVPRSLLDVARWASRRTLERACNQAEVLGVLDVDGVRELLGRVGGSHGARPLQAVLELGQVGEGITRSELEARFLALCRRAALPQPAVNEWIAVEGEELQADFVWHRQGVIVETDGFATHRTRQAFHGDRRRDRALSLAGWQVVRFTWEDVTSEPQVVAKVVRKLLAARAPLHPPAA